MKRKGTKGEKNGNDIPSPHCVADYNKNMGGVDYSDQTMKYYNYVRISEKWYRHVFYHLLGLSSL